MKKIFIIIIAIILVTLLALLIFSNKKNNNRVVFPTPTPLKGGVPNGASGDKYVGYPQYQELVRRSYLVQQLTKILPYSGVNFSLSYTLSKNQFTLYINPNNQQAGNDEFNNFLKQNGIDDRSWITNLVVSSVPVTPVP